MRILVATPFLPHPAASHGGGVYMDALLAGLAAEAEVTVLSFCSLDEAAQSLELSAGLRAVHRIAHPQRNDFCGLAKQRHQARMLLHWGLRGLPLGAAKFASGTMRQLLPEIARRCRADIALFEFRQMAQFLPYLARIPRVICDHEGGDPEPVDFGRARDARLIPAYIRRFYRQADQIQALNRLDADRLSELCDRSVTVRPATVTLPAQSTTPGSAPPIALFLGSYRHHPNPEAAIFLAREVWPLVQRQMPAAELWLAGPDPTPAVEALAANHVRVLGFVDDLPGLLASVRSLVTPLFSGGGSRIKVLTALAHGLPVIGNELAFRGISAGSALRRGETAAEIAEQTLAVLASPAAADAQGRLGRDWAEKNLDPRALAQQQIAGYAKLIAAHAGRR